LSDLKAIYFLAKEIIRLLSQRIQEEEIEIKEVSRRGNLKNLRRTRMLDPDLFFIKFLVLDAHNWLFRCRFAQ